MELLERDIAEHYADYQRAQWIGSKKLKDEVVLSYYTHENENVVEYVGVISPFAPHFDELELAMVFGYSDYFKGGLARIYANGDFKLEFKKEN